MKNLYVYFYFFSLVNTELMAKNLMILKLESGDVEIGFIQTKPNHVKRFQELSNSGKYDGVVFHRVIDGFMAQTGDVKFDSNSPEFNLSLAGMVDLTYRILNLNLLILHILEESCQQQDLQIQIV